MRRAALLVPLLALATGCAAFSEDGGGSASDTDGTIRVAAAFYPLAFVAERVGGSDVEVTNLTQPGGEPHDLEIDVKSTADIADADLVLVQHGFQPAVDDAVSEVARGTVLDVEDVVELLPADDAAADHAEDEHAEGEHTEDEHTEGEHTEDEHTEDEHTEDEHAEDEHAEDEHAEEDHDHGETDPHFWQDPDLVATFAEAVADRLADIDPDRAQDYQANAADLIEELHALADEYAAALSGCERDTVVVSHDAFGYLERFGLEIEGIAGLSPDAEPTPADLARLQELIRDEGITTVFSERLVSPKLSETLADDLGIGTAILDPIEGLSDETTDGDYLSLMRENLSALVAANGCP